MRAGMQNKSILIGGGVIMNREILRRISILLVFFVLFSSIPLGYADSIELNSIGGGQANGTFDVYFEEMGGWTLVDSVGANMYFKDYQSRYRLQFLMKMPCVSK